MSHPTGEPAAQFLVSPAAPLPRRESGPSPDRWPIAILAALLFGLRVLYAFRLRLNSDETQHLHVVWAWAHGLLPYRDVFDNHTPLFHLACAPLFWLIGETPDVVIYLRLAMIACFGASLWFTLRIGEALFSRRVGIWSAVFTGFLPFFFLKTIEFRTDDLWTAAWLATIAVLVGGRPTPRRMFAGGLWLGIALGVSLKTTLLLLALFLAGGVVLFFWRQEASDARPTTVIRQCMALVAGLLIVPAAIVTYFAFHHATAALYYGAILHNLLPAPAPKAHFSWHSIWFPLALPVLLGVAGKIFRRQPDRGLAVRRSLVLLMPLFYLALLYSYWPIITTQDYLPVVPLLVVWLTPGALRAAEECRRPWKWTPPLAWPLAFVAFVALELAGLMWTMRPRSHLACDLAYLGHVLRVTNPDDYVMDAKSGAIFRRRPFYYALENVTRLRMQANLIKDDIVECLIATRTCMASADRLKGSDRQFVEANYLPFDRKMRVAGQYLHPDPQTGHATFEIAILAKYTFLSSQGPMEGMLDGKPLTGPVLLAPGHHEFLSANPSSSQALVWAQAAERGYTPFAPIAMNNSEAAD